MINWRSIKEVGYPKNPNGKYLVTDGIEIATSNISGITYYGKDGGKFTFKKWSGDDCTYEDNQCCSGEIIFDLIPTHWCPIEELNLPNKTK